MPISRLRLWPTFVLAALLLIGAVVAPSPAAAQNAAMVDDVTVVDETRDEAEEEKVTVYVTEWCPYCRRTRDLLDELGVKHVVKDIEKDAEALAEFRKKGQGDGGIPLTDFDGKIIRGYQEKVFRKLAAEMPDDMRVADSEAEAGS
jgi:glutaredoxin